MNISDEFLIETVEQGKSIYVKHNIGVYLKALVFFWLFVYFGNQVGDGVWTLNIWWFLVIVLLCSGLGFIPLLVILDKRFKQFEQAYYALQSKED